MERYFVHYDNSIFVPLLFLSPMSHRVLIYNQTFEMPSTKYQLWALHFHFVVFHRNTGWLSRTKRSCRLLRMRFCWEIKVEIYRLVHKFWLRAWFASIQTDKSILTYRIRQTGKIGRHFGSLNVFYVHVTQSYLHRLIVEYKLRQHE